MFAGIREAAGTNRAEIDAGTVADVIAQACERFGPRFTELLPTCRIWLNGEPATGAESVGARDEVAILPPVSGG